MKRYNFDEYAAALSRLPWQPHAGLDYWDLKQRFLSSGLQDNPKIMNVLDGLAALCVRDSSESYFTALLLEGDAIRLFVTSSGGDVPDHVEPRLQAIWQHMRVMHAHEDAPAVRRGDRSRAGFAKLCRAFELEQCRFAMPALRARLAEDAASVAQSLRVMLGCHAPHTPEAAVLLQCCTDNNKPILASERQFLELCLTSLEELRRLGAPDDSDLTDDTIHLILQNMTSLNTEVKRVLSKNATIFKMMEAITDIPVRFHLQRILWLSDPRAAIPRAALSSQFAPWIGKRLVVTLVPSIHCAAPPAPNLDTIASNASLTTTNDGQVLSDIIRLQLVEPLEALLRDHEQELPQGTPDSPRTIRLHGAMALLHHIDALPAPQRPVEYIGQSEQCCLPCYLFLRAYNLYGARGLSFYGRVGTHGRTPPFWAPPELSCSGTDEFDEIFRKFVSSNVDCFFRAWDVCAKAQEVKRGVRELDEYGDDGTDEEEENYNSDESDYYIPRFQPD